MAQLRLTIYFTGRLCFLSYKVDFLVNRHGLKCDINEDKLI